MKTNQSWLRKAATCVFALAMLGAAANAGVISAGYQDSFGLQSDHTLWAWGSDGGAANNYTDPARTQTVSVAKAQLGLGAVGTYAYTPTQSGTDKTWIDVVGSMERSFGIQSDGSLWGWGYDGAPAEILLGHKYADLYHYEQAGALGMGTQMCEVISRVYGNVPEWTTNFSGGAGNHTGGAGNELYTSKDVESTTTPSYTNSIMNGLAANRPTQIGTARTWKQVAVGSNFCLGLRTDGSIWSWGTDGGTNTYKYNTNGFTAVTECKAFGRLGHGNMVVATTNYGGGESSAKVVQHYTNTNTDYPYDWQYVSTTTNTGLSAVTTNFVQYARALNEPTKITAPNSAAAALPAMVCIAAGLNHSAAVGSNGSLWTWGKNQKSYLVSVVYTNQYGYGYYIYSYATGSVLGLGNTNLFSTNVPTRVDSGTKWASVSAGMNANFTMAIKKDGSLWGWGDNGAIFDGNSVRVCGYLGLDSDTLFANTPTRVGTDNNWAMVSAGNQHCLGLKSDGSLYAWGRNDSGCLGIGRTDYSMAEPTRVGADTDWVFVSAGYNHSLALKLDGSLYAWGANACAQLGDTEGDAYEPVLISSGWGFSSGEGDFDGDCLADPYVVADGNWYIYMSSGDYAPQGPFALSVPGGVPVAADFDGDGLADPAMVANGNWTIWCSAFGHAPQGPFAFSAPGGVPVAADFDGDGAADPAMVVNGNWYIWPTSFGYAQQGPFAFSAPGETPMAGDFDGDQCADPAVVVDNNWTVRMSSKGY
ncbi:MAG: hypothetical protein PHP98_01860, partial [Kiritimatiellae bacterium]|nr:hypothetical protein [Kiritimatiellia bacterium]